MKAGEPDEGYPGDVTLAHGQALLEIGAGHLLVLALDALGVESVQRLPLRRAGAADPAG